jgi:hypothetical protein
MRSRRLLLAPVLLATLAAPLAACSSDDSGPASVAPPPAKADVRTVDWNNASYSVACPGLNGPSDQQVPVTLVNGAGTTAPIDWFGVPAKIEVTAADVAFGDLTGDGRDEAVVRLTCTPEQSNGLADEIQVFGPGSELLASPVLRNRTDADFAPAVRTLTVSGGAITGTASYWAAGDPHCCPSQTLPFTLRWNATASSFDES